MSNKRRAKVIGQILLVSVLIAGFLVLRTLLKNKHFLLFSFMLLLCSILPAYWRFEREPLKTQTLMFLAILIALAVAGRVPFASLPSVQAASFVIILGGISLGPELGFVTGSTTALVSNMFLGQGPWTPWQMFAWGLMGLTAGLIGRTQLSHRLMDHGSVVCLGICQSADHEVLYFGLYRQRRFRSCALSFQRCLNCIVVSFLGKIN